MKTFLNTTRVFVLIGIVMTYALPAAANGPAPAVIEKGLHLLKNAGAGAAFEAWAETGLVDDAPRFQRAATVFKEQAKLLKNYRSHEVIEVKEIGKTSKIVYVAMTFERGVLYGSFLVWRSDDDWVIQRTEFSSKPEAIMPWLVGRAGISF